MTKTMIVLYDGACPVCRREIGFYKRRAGADRIDWRDVSLPETAALPVGLSREQVLQRFHVISPSGKVQSGGTAFAELWTALPAFRALGRLFKLPVMSGLIEVAYRFFLQVRASIKALNKCASSTR